MEKVNLNSTADFQNMMFGQLGSRYIEAAGTGESGEVYKVITALEATVVTLVQPKGDATLTDLPIPAGVTVYGKFTSVSVTSGSVLAYIG